MLAFRDPAPGSRELQFVRAALERGELVVVPTDTVYGLAAHALDQEACHHLYEVKGRDPGQPTAVLFPTLEELAHMFPTMSERAGAACEVLLPGPFTLVIRNPTGALGWLCGGDPGRIGVRVPDDALALPPLAATSANPAGMPTAASVADLDPSLAEQVACVVDRGELDPDAASTVIDIVAWEFGGEPQVLRDPADRAGDALTALAQL